MNIVLMAGLAAVALSAQGMVTTVAGAGGRGFGETQLYYPGGVAFDRLDNLYIADSYNHRIQKMTPDGVVTTVLGTGVSGLGDDQLRFPRTLAVDQTGTVYIADSYNQRVQKLAPNGPVTTIAGRGGLGSELTQLAFPRGVAVDPNGNVFVSDNYNHRVLRITSEGVITNVAGGRGPGDEPTQLNFPFGIALNDAGDLYIGDAFNHRVQKVTPGGAGATVGGTAGPGPGINQLANPVGVDVDSARNLFVADTANNRVQRITPQGEVTTVAGGFGAGSGERQLDSPFDTAVDSFGNLYVVDTYNHRIQKITYPAPQSAPQLRHAATNRPAAGSPNQIMRLSPEMACPEPMSILVGGYQAAVKGALFTIPDAVDPGVPTDVYVSCQTRSLIPRLTLPMLAAQPKLFVNWNGQASAELADTGALIDANSPVRAGALVSLFGTGFGALETADLNGLRRVQGDVTVKIGGLIAEVLYAGTVAGETVGLTQINVRVPPEVKPGLQTVVVSMDGLPSQGGVVVAVK